MLPLDSPPEGDTLVLETHNGDNPPIELEKFQAFYPATRVLFKAQPADELLLYYGNPQAAAPRYDLSLVAGQLLAADQAEAALGAEEQLKKSWGEGHRPARAASCSGESGRSRGGAAGYYLTTPAPIPAKGIVGNTQ